MIGNYFHGCDEIQWQGMIIGEPSPGMFMVQTFSWLTGNEHSKQLVPITAMTGWTFYDTAEEMSNAYEYGGVRQHWERVRALKSRES